MDGLDEFEGLDAVMARFFGAVADSVNVKVCASSRPHVVYESSFANRPSLRLQDLTHNDIRTYVQDRLVNDDSMQDLFAREPVETPLLVEEIVTTAEGVFLWVYLIVTALLRGLGNRDEIADLRRKLKLLPKDLKQLYLHMLLEVDEDYKEEAVNFFKLVNATQAMENDSAELVPMTILSLCLAHQPQEKLSEITMLFRESPDDVILRCQDMSRRLKTRSGGLLEVQLRGARPTDLSPSMKVEYHHRTVRDFLVAPDIRCVLQAETSFDADYAMFKACVFQLQLSAKGENDQPIFQSALTYARRSQYQMQMPQSQDFLLNQLYSRVPDKLPMTMPGRFLRGLLLKMQYTPP